VTDAAATTARADAPHGSPAARPLWGSYRWLLRVHLRSAVGALVVLVVAATVGIVAVDRLGTVTNSVVGFARQGVIWFPFSLSIILVIAHLPVHVQMGLPRWVLGRVTVLVALTMSVFYAVTVVAILQLERWVYGLAGWEHRIVDDLTFVHDTSQVGLLLGEYFFAAAAGQLCGLLCGLVYYRVGGWWGTLALPLTVGPVILVQSGMSADVAFLDGDLAVGTAGGGLLRAVVATLVLALVVLGYRAVLRSTPVRTAPVV